MRASLVADCFAAEMCRLYSRCLPGVSDSNTALILASESRWDWSSATSASSGAGPTVKLDSSTRIASAMHRVTVSASRYRSPTEEKYILRSEREFGPLSLRTPSVSLSKVPLKKPRVRPAFNSPMMTMFLLWCVEAGWRHFSSSVRPEASSIGLRERISSGHNCDVLM